MQENNINIQSIALSHLRLASDCIEKDIEELWIQMNKTKNKTIRIVDPNSEFAWRYKLSSWGVLINERFVFNPKVFIHELTHFYSSHFSIVWWNKKVRTWLYSEWFKFINEWITQLLNLESITKHKREILSLREKHYSDMQMYYFLLNPDKNSLRDYWNSQVDQLTWWYEAYIEEVRLVNVILDFLALCNSWIDSSDFEKERERIWVKIKILYFLWDIQWFIEILNKIDPSGFTSTYIYHLKGNTNTAKHLTENIINYLRERYPQYSERVIPTKL